MKTLKLIKCAIKVPVSPLTIVFIYAFAGGLWILFADSAIESLSRDPRQLYVLHAYKGWFFLCITSILLYFMILTGLRRIKKREADTNKIIEYFPIPTVVIDNKNNILKINRKFIDSFGYTKNDFKNADEWFLLAYPDPVYRKVAQELWVKELDSIQNNEKEFASQFLTIVDKHQQKHEIHFNVMALSDCFIIVLNDITEQKRVETALRESEYRYRTLFETAGNAIIIMKNEQYFDCNFKALELYGCTREQLLASKPWEFSPLIQPDGQRSQDKAMQIAQKTRQSDEAIFFEWTHEKLDGAQFTAEITLNKIFFNNEIYIQGIVQDVTERKNAEKAILYRTALEKLILKISTRFTSLPPDEIDNNIELALHEICEFVGVDSGYLCRFSQNMSLLNMTHLWSNQKLNAVKGELQNIPVNPETLRIDKILNYQEVNIENLDDVNDQTGFEKKLIQSQGAKSLIKLPVVFKDQLVGILGLTSIQEKRVWQENEISILRIASQIFFNFLLRNQDEEELRNSERNYREIFNSTNDAMLIYNIDNNMVMDINNAFIDLFGFTAPEIVNAHLKELIYGKILSLTEHEVHLLESIGTEPALFEWQAQTKNGNHFLIEVSVKKVSINGKAHALAVIRNIQDKKIYEDAIKQSEKRYREIFENANEAIFVVQNTRIVFLNLKTTEILGYTRPELVSMSIFDFIHPEDKSFVLERYKKRQDGGDVPARYSVRLLTKNNEIRWVDLNAVIISWNEKIATLVFMNDITERRKTEEALLSSEQRLALIFNSVRDNILLAKVTSPGKFVTVAANLSLLKETDCTTDKVIGQEVSQVFPKSYTDVLLKSFKILLKTKTVLFGKEQKIGDKLFETTYTPIFADSGKCTHILTVMHDLSERKKKEQALQIADRASRLASLGTLAAGISHEINQPLTALKIKVDSLLYWGEEKPELMKINLEQNLQFISREADKIDAIIKHMRSLAQIDHIPPPERVDINNIIKNILSLIGQQLQSHHIDVILKLHEPALFVLAHETPMEQVIINLVINAMYALDTLEKEPKKIILSTKLLDKKCIIEVEDNGPGIPEQNILRIFDPFFTTKIGKEGMGLGLAIVQNILSSIGGVITAENVSTGGAIFRITL